MSLCNNQLLQVKLDNQYIQTWTPLECIDKTAKNCGASALALAKIVPKDLAQLISRDTEISGINQTKMLEIINKETALEAKYGLRFDSIRNFQKIFEELEPGNGTIVMFIRYNETGHIVILAKDTDNKKHVLESQYLQIYTEDAIIPYIETQLYTHFFVFCKTTAYNQHVFNTIIQSILGKRKLDELQLPISISEPEHKKRAKPNKHSDNIKMDIVIDENDNDNMMDIVNDDNMMFIGSGKKPKKTKTKFKKNKTKKNRYKTNKNRYKTNKNRASPI